MPEETGRRPACTYGLRTAIPVRAPPEEVAAQRLRLGWADDLTHTSTGCGMTVIGRIWFVAMLGLVDAVVTGMPFDLVHPPTKVPTRLAETAHVLTQPTLDRAAVAAGRLLSCSGPHAPIGPPLRFAAAF